MSMEYSLGKNGWEESKESIDSYRTLGHALYTSRYPNDYDYSSGYEGPLPEVHYQTEPVLSASNTIALTRDVIDATRQEMKHTLRGNGDVEEALKLSLTIDLSRRGIESMPEETVQILKYEVERLMLSHNQISQLPSRFSECTSLTYLSLKDNRLRDVPRAICRLQNVQILDLSRNKLNRLPEEIVNMKALRVFSVMDNNLENLPFSLGFLESLRVLKLSRNPLNELLRSIVDGNDGSPSPLSVPLPENEKESLITTKVKLYLKAEAHALESGGDSSSESPLDTPRPLKRNASLRFPVVPAMSGSESGADIKSPGFNKPAIPARSHFRVASGQISQLQNAPLRRPGVSPLMISSERYRSNSESVLQATQTIKGKRMGMITKKTSDLGTVEETRSNRNSHHYRGFSHASVLRDKHTNSFRKSGGSGSSTPVSPVDDGRHVRDFFHRAAGLLIRKRKGEIESPVFKSSVSVFVSMHQVHSMVASLISLMKEGTSKRSSLERRYLSAATRLGLLEQVLSDYIKADGEGSFSKKLRVGTRDILVAYHHVGIMLWHSSAHLVGAADEPYIRALVTGVYGAMLEARIAFSGQTAKVQTVPKASNAEVPEVPPLPPLPPNPPLAYRMNTLTKERPQTMRRLHSEATVNGTRKTGVMKTSSNPYTSVPLHTGMRSRSNSRTNVMASSAASSVANTPKSETFMAPSTPDISSDTTLASASYLDPVQDLLFEKIFRNVTLSVKKALAALPDINSKFRKYLEAARSNFVGEELIDVWSRLSTRSLYCQDMCEAVKIKLSSLQLNQPELQNAADFWRLYCRYAASFVAMMQVIIEAKKHGHIDVEMQRILQPVHSCIKNAVTSIRNSPWAWALSQDEPPKEAVTNSQWQGQSHMNGGTNGRVYGNGNANGHHRTRGDSGSGSSPYVASTPATPMSAALGPAAVATMPSTPAVFGSMNHIRSGVYEQTDTLMAYTAIVHNQQKELYRR